RANILGPVLAAVFANSPLRDGAPTGWASTRLQVWSAIDPSRTASAWAPGRGCASWADYVLDARVMLICRSGTDFAPRVKPLSFRRWLTQGHELGYPTAEDLDYHLTTLFPPVRPKGWLELRFLDALPPQWWPLATAVAAGLVRDPEAGARAERAADPFAGQWPRAARFGLADPGLASAAQECFAAAAGTLTDGDSGLGGAVVEYAQRFVARGRTPADERLDAWRSTGSALLAEDAERVAVMAR
ncbi:MAG: glutamate-cysteine ligase family protein, partial [Acidimicrobiales bacterium]